jgi:hypothetical protein
VPVVLIFDEPGDKTKNKHLIAWRVNPLVAMEINELV